MLARGKIEIFVKMENGVLGGGTLWHQQATESAAWDGVGGGGREVFVQHPADHKALSPCLPKEFAKEAEC